MRRGPNDKLNSNAVQLMAAQGNEVVLCIATEPLSWPREDSHIKVYILLHIYFFTTLENNRTVNRTYPFTYLFFRDIKR